ncbi:hypothetical protein CDL15_Pgr027403 [Punica granatum]|uniref:Uncharacterized protein n=1 Tax=Punica granatum TaxID=22663 RepID=A0A218Y207_PUNGR|nr:hypothetical protein CDL15_Pgr027403 [Punica granatum]
MELRIPPPMAAPRAAMILAKIRRRGVSSDIVAVTSIRENPSENIKTVMELWKVVDLLESVRKVEYKLGIVSSATALNVATDIR